jgi:tRNA(Ile)-lysidine synthetase-like protein
MPKKPQITLLQKLALNIRYSKDKKVIIACSGGSDSMVLLELFRTHELPSSGIIVCHINHELRESATRDENIVREYCNKYDITSEFLSLDVKKGAKEAKETLEEYARNIRREWLEKMRKKHKADIIATAHHADDQAETILYRITK